MSSFVHLHTHSHYSLLDGLGRIEDLIEAAKKNGMTALALTDHGVLYGAIEFYQKCLKAEIKPIIGMEAYLSDEPISQTSTRQQKPYHLILLAKNKTGYRNLLQLTSVAHLKGFYYKPRIDWELLHEHSDGLICLTACLNGPIARPISQKNEALARENLKKLQKIFGPEDLYLEMQHRPTLADQSLVNNTLKKYAQEYNLPLVATNDIHYVEAQDALAHDILICLQTKAKVSDKDRMSYLGEDFSLLSTEEMQEHFADTPEALTNTVKIAERCNLEIELGKITLPQFNVPDGLTAEEYVRQLCLQNIPRRFGCAYEELDHDIRDRLDYELDIIFKTGFTAYFLIVQDFVNWAKNNGIVVGPGRGSAAGSLVSYLLNITNVDPIKYKLLFERFLNPERISMPDIDMDFADTRREDVLKYVEERYGHDRVAQIITFGTMAARAAVRDVGRVLGYGYGFCDRISKLIPMFTTLTDALEKVRELKELYEQDDQAKRLIDMAKQLEGIARHSSTHACAVLITKDPLVSYVPLQHASSDDQTVISQYSMHPVEDLGLLKMDFLGLKNLTILENALRIIRKTTGQKIGLDAIPLDDAQTFQLLQKGDTTGVFQLESSGMTRYLKKLKPTSIEDIIAMISLYRPGPMEFIEDYINGKQNKIKISYLHPDLEPILSSTYGIAVYQEQVLEIARKLAGFTYGQADILRKAVGKKIKKLLDEQEELLVSGMIKNKIPADTAKKIWDFIVPFARYGFNRSHAASYALISFQTAYLKAHYPAQFMAALLTADQDDMDKIVREVHECSKMGLHILPPDVNESFESFSVVLDNEQKPTKDIRFGLNAIKNVGQHISAAIITERKSNGTFASLEDFLKRIHDKDLNKKSLECLIKCGALDRFGERGQMLANLDELLSFNKKLQSENKRGVTNLFADLPIQISSGLVVRSADPADSWQCLAWEKELLGLYITNHPFKPYLKWLEGTIDLIAGISATDGQEKTVAGIVTILHKIVTKSGEPMLFVTIEDSTATMEIIVFPKLLASQPHLFEMGKLLLAKGKISAKDDSPKLLIDQIQELTPETVARFQDQWKNKLKLWLHLSEDFNKEKLGVLKVLLEQYPGSIPVYLVLHNGSERRLKTTMKVSISEGLQQRVENLIGTGKWVIEERA